VQISANAPQPMAVTRIAMSATFATDDSSSAQQPLRRFFSRSTAKPAAVPRAPSADVAQLRHASGKPTSGASLHSALPSMDAAVADAPDAQADACALVAADHKEGLPTARQEAQHAVIAASGDRQEAPTEQAALGSSDAKEQAQPVPACGLAGTANAHFMSAPAEQAYDGPAGQLQGNVQPSLAALKPEIGATAEASAAEPCLNADSPSTPPPLHEPDSSHAAAASSSAAPERVDAVASCNAAEQAQTLEQRRSDILRGMDAARRQMRQRAAPGDASGGSSLDLRLALAMQAQELQQGRLTPASGAQLVCDWCPAWQQPASS
jgi:hypothetical protein